MNQPLDILMTQLGLTNADLVNASTEQLSFKMVSKGRKGRRLTPNIQDKILAALLKVKPQLKLRRRDIFMYDIGQTVVEQTQSALSLARDRKVSYPEFVDLLSQAGITRYRAEVAPNRIIFYGVLGEAHMEQGVAISPEAPSAYLNQDALRAAIGDVQKGLIEHAVFLKRIHDAGITAYEVNIRKRNIKYMSAEQSYKENIPVTGAQPSVAPVAKPKPAEKKPEKKQAKKKRKQRPGLTTKARMSLNKRRFSRKKR